MKKFTTLAIGILSFALVATSSFGQSVLITPIASAGPLIIKREGIGLSQTSENGLVKVGTYVDNVSGAYIQTHSNHPLYFSTNNGSAKITLLQNGNVSIGNNITPTNKLQIGNAGTGFSGNDIAIGNGTQGMSFFQNATNSFWYSNVDFAIMPNGGTGRVGIGTTTPLAPLHVAGQSTISGSMSGRLFNFGTNALFAYTGNEFPSIIADAAIISKTTIGAFQAITSSDARIKNIIGLSNNAQDLAKLKKIEITDYTMKDVATWGNQGFKKVIAQQVEKAYPEAVQKQRQVIPDIYALAEKVSYDAVKKELKCSLSKSYDIKTGDKIELFHPEKGKIQTVVASVSGNDFMVKDWEFATEKIFVFGREVSDFRTVDYDALSMLSISAVQQLAKENEVLKNEINAMKANNKDLSARVEAIEAALRTPSGK